MRGRTEIPKGIDQTGRGGQIGHFVEPAQLDVEFCQGPASSKVLFPLER
jgi:hypothetical protein